MNMVDQSEVISVDVDSLLRWNKTTPRYTSYPTAPQFYLLEESVYRQKIADFEKTQKPLSVYVHIPFCKRMCLFCACSVVLNRSPERQKIYLDYLIKEINQLPFLSRPKVVQLHLGGGTPTSLQISEFELLMEALHRKFSIQKEGEISIEIDPRTVFADKGEKLAALRHLGFNRVSFGVQDLDPIVQEAVRRRQSEEMTVETYRMARDLNFDSVNLDLIYGLPHQTPKSFARTADKILELKPDRIALFSYAKVPWHKIHQKSIPDELFPSTEEKFRIYAETREKFMKGGYIAIGMDHFALPHDSIAMAYAQKTLTRNFQGYSVGLAENMIGLGVTAIGFLGNGYFQNCNEIKAYQAKVEEGKLPTHRGYILTEEDLIRKWVIQNLMCHFELSKAEFNHRFGLDFDAFFIEKKGDIEQLKQEGLLLDLSDKVCPTPTGRLFIRLIAALFDAYQNRGKFSGAI